MMDAELSRFAAVAMLSSLVRSFSRVERRALADRVLAVEVFADLDLADAELLVEGWVEMRPFLPVPFGVEPIPNAFMLPDLILPDST